MSDLFKALQYNFELWRPRVAKEDNMHYMHPGDKEDAESHSAFHTFLYIFFSALAGNRDPCFFFFLLGGPTGSIPNKKYNICLLPVVCLLHLAV